ncbi:hypothetical protein [Lysobacter sp. Root690]|uniref:hypothetical protein n=1 Tax=Lysobacter sp. Root690 TaxID=1736588 RepID=UPI0012F84357|nr:hypothetical protein [Lysobacter sp. Root690]
MGDLLAPGVFRVVAGKAKANPPTPLLQRGEQQRRQRRNYIGEKQLLKSALTFELAVKNSVDFRSHR